jgi:mannose-6-phosphate isomerase
VEQPSVYKDSNHKPEMVIALTKFQCLCGLRPLPEIMSMLDEFPEFRQLLVANGRFTHIVIFLIADKKTGFSLFSFPDDRDFLKTLFTAFITSNRSTTKFYTDALIQRLLTSSQISDVEELILSLIAQYPADIGIFSPILMNYMCLEPGESFFIGANTLHAYLSGDCIECMALSDNVVRAGLTPKTRDIPLLCSMLNYRSFSLFLVLSLL